MVKITPVLMAGGSGTRLWPVSRKSFPKQFADLVGEETGEGHGEGTSIRDETDASLSSLAPSDASPPPVPRRCGWAVRGRDLVG